MFYTVTLLHLTTKERLDEDHFNYLDYYLNELLDNT